MRRLMAAALITLLLAGVAPARLAYALTPNPPFGLRAQRCTTGMNLWWSWENNGYASGSFKAYMNGQTWGLPVETDPATGEYKASIVLPNPATAGTLYVTFTSAPDESGPSNSVAIPAAPASGCVTAGAGTPGQPPATPDAPTLTLGTVSNDSAALSWSASAGATGYRVYRNGQLVATVTGTNHVDTGLLQNTGYSWYVVPFNANGNGSQSNTVTGTTTLTPGLAAPTLELVDKTATTVDLSWSEVDGALRYLVYRIGPGGTVGDLLGRTEGTSWHDTTLSPATTYGYYVKPEGATGTGQRASNQVQVTTDPEPGVPQTPTGLAVTDKTCTTVTLTWNPQAGATGYVVEFGAGAFVQVTGTTATVTGLEPGETYAFFVRSQNEGGVSLPSAPVQATLPAPCYEDPGPGDPPPPDGGGAVLRYYRDCTNETVSLTWEDIFPGHTYLLYHDDWSYGELIYEGTGTSYTFHPTQEQWELNNGALEFLLMHRVGEGAYFIETVWTENCDPVPPPPPPPDPITCEAPGPVTLTATFDQGTVTLTWTPAANAVSYKVYHNGQTVGTVSATTWAGTYAIDGGDHSFEVRAVNECGHEGAADTETLTCPVQGPLAAPNLTRSDMDAGEVILEWDTVDGATGYRVLMRRRGWSEWTPVADTTETQHQGNYPRDGQVYEFTVEAVNDCQESPPSQTVSGSCLCSLKDYLVSGAPIPPPPAMPEIPTPMPPAPPIDTGRRSGKVVPPVPTLPVPPDIPPPPALPPVGDPDLCAWGPCKEEPGQGQQPNGPQTPPTPSAPVAPTGPLTPSPPTVPNGPPTPSAPIVPNGPPTPSAPSVSNGPLTPSAPLAPNGPLTPSAPLTPLLPYAPLTPDEPLTPTD